MASKQLTAKVRLNTKDAEKSIDRLIKKINQVNNATKKISSSGSQLPQQYSNANSKLNGIQGKMKSWLNSQKQISNELKSTDNLLGGIGSKLRMLASTYLGVMGLKAGINTSDTITSAQNRMNALNGGDIEATQEQMDKMYFAANRSRMAYTDMISNASKSMTLAGESFGGNMDNAIRFQEIMAKTYAIGGASAEEMSTSMYQMIQALGAGTLAGDELRSVREGAPLAYKAIEKYVQGVMAQTDKTKEYATASLKDIAADGLVTSDMVVAAIMKSGNEVDKQFNNMAITFGQAWDRIKSTAVKAFEPVSKMLNDMLNRAVKNGVFEKIETFFWNLSKGLQTVLKVVETTANWIADNWIWIKKVIIGALTVIMSFIAAKSALSIACAIAEAIAWAQANWMVLAAVWIVTMYIAALITVIGIFGLWKIAAIDTLQAIAYMLLVVAALLVVCGFTSVALFVGLLAVIVLYFEEACGVIARIAAGIVNILSAAWNAILSIIQSIVALVVFVGVTILNIAIGVINGIIYAMWTLIEPVVSIIEHILNCCNGGFNSFGGAVANLLGQIIGWFLSLGKVVTTIIDAIFGTNWTAGLSSLQDSVLAWGKNENSITIERDFSTIPRLNAGKATTATFDGIGKLSTGYADYDKWASSASTWGAGIADKINSWGAQYQNGDWMSDLGKKFGLDIDSVLDHDYDKALENIADSYTAPNPNDLIANALGDDVDDIAKNTGSMAKSMELSKEDLDYLRKIAEMEWKKEYTSNIKIDMSNYNTVNGESDLDGIVTKLSEKLYEEMNVMANGVYA